jgi:two-component system, LytTR family, sensor kinase
MYLSEQTKADALLLNFFVSKKWRIVRHVGMIIVLYIIIISPTSLSEEFLQSINIKNPKVVIEKVNLASYLMYGIVLMLIYVNLFFLIPKLLLKGKYIAYLLMCVLLASAKYGFEEIIFNFVKPYLPPDFDLINSSFTGYLESTTIAFIFLISTAGYKIFKKSIFESKQLAELKETKLNEELTNLKNQINPHFLFNTLNNLNTLINTNTSKASTVVLGLSDVLRFYLYEADKEKVLLKKDIEILLQILELEKIRRDDFQFSLKYDNSINGIFLPAFIFTNFVENAIKHSVNNSAFSFVHIEFKKENNTLVFTCENSVPPIKPNTQYGGLGLPNIKRRLDLIYKNTYGLVMKEKDNKYFVKLEIPT